MDKEELPLKRLMGELKKKTTQLEKAKKNLEESEERYRNLFENSPNIIFTLDLDGRINLVNKAVENLVGYNKEEIIGKRFKEFVPSKYLPSLLDAFEKEIRGIAVPTMEIEVMAKDGEKIPIELLHGSVPIKEKGKLVGIQITAMDLRERKETEKKLKESEQKYKDLFENASDILFTIDRLGRFTSGNKKAEEISGYKREELIGKSFKKIVPLKYAPKILKLIQKGIKGEIERGEIEIEIKDKKGRLIPIEMSGRPIWKNGKVIGIQGIARDITNRKRAEDELKVSEEKYRTLTEQLKDVVVRLSPDGYLQYISPVVKEFSGYDANEEIGKHFSNYISKSSLEKGMTAFEKVVTEKKPQLIEMMYKPKEGEEFPVEVSTIPLIENGKIIAVQCVLRDITERKKAEEALRASEEKYRAAVEQSVENIYIMDVETRRILEANATLQNLLGYSSEEIKELTVYDFVAHSPENIDRKIEEVMKQKRLLIGERRNRRKDGGLVDVEVSASFITYGGKKALCVVSRDITERKKAEEELRKSEKRFQDIVANTGDWIWEVDADGKYTYISPVVERILGYTTEEVIGKHFYDFFHPDERKQLKAAVFEVFTRKERFISFINRNIHKDGHVVILETSGIPIIGHDGKLLGYRGADRDITERKKAEKVMEASEEKYRTLTENINVGIYRNTPGPKGRFIEANPATIKMFGYDKKEDILKFNVSNFYQNPEDRKKFNEKMLKDGFVRNEEIRLKKKDGTPIWGSVTAVAIRDEKGTIKYYDGMIDDITKRKEVEEELQKSYEETKMALEREREFIEKTSHNFFNPLCIAKGYIALQLERDIPEETRKEVESAKRAVERIEEIVKKSVGRG